MTFFESYAEIEFLWPYAALLALLPLLIRKKVIEDDQRTDTVAPNISAYSKAHALYGFCTQSAQREHKRKKVFLYLLWLLMTLGMMRPQYFGTAIELPLEGRDLMLAIDISPSMKEVDMPLNGRRAMRIDVVKSVVGDFAERRQGDRIGLILFGSQPYVQSPLSFDTETVNTLLQEAFLGMAGQATAIGDAIALAVKRLRERPEQSRVLILLTDGANTAGEIPPEKAAQLAASFGIKIYTVGIGADEMLQRSFFGTRTINPSADLDEEMLSTIAATTDGKYFRARNEEELGEIYNEIEKLEPIESSKRTYRPQKSLTYIPVLCALALFVLYKLIVVIQRGRLSSKVKAEANRDG
jgi:Ca-activated chloride channel family protein